MLKKSFLDFGRRWLSKKTRRSILRITQWPPVNRVRFGQLRRLEPITRDWGSARGKPVDRHYIETFLAAHAVDVQGRVLEVGDNSYTLAFGGPRVVKSEVIHASEGNPKADYVADFAHAPHLPSATFDCIICTQTLQLVADIRQGISTLHRILKPGGVLLATLPGISQIYCDNESRWHDYWRLTAAGARYIFDQHFPAELTTVRTYGNVLATTAFLYGLAAEELTSSELAHYDAFYPMIVAVRAQKSTEQK
jgi:SAM-dependent methyltransferase